MTNNLLSPALAQFLQTARKHQESGNALQAEALYQMVLQAKPNQPDALALYSDLLIQCGQTQRAKAMLLGARNGEGSNAQLDVLLAGIYVQTGELDLADESMQRAVAHAPANVEIHLNYCRLAIQRRRFSEAVDRYLSAIALFPSHPDLGRELAQAHMQAGDLGSAAEQAERLLTADNADPDVHVFLGSIYSMQSRHAEAEAQFQTALTLNPKSVDAYVNLGSTLLCSPDRLADAQSALENALALSSKDADIHSNLAIVYGMRGRPMDAVASLGTAIKLNPDAAPAHSNLLFLMQHLAEFSDQEVFQAHLAFAAQFETPLKQHWQPFANDLRQGRKLRVGYVSGDFREHAVSYYIEPILQSHNRARFEIYCYHNAPNADAKTTQLRSYSDHWIECHSLSDDDLANRIRSDQIDILIDLSGHTSGNRLLVFARKPAPVQMTWIGYAGTSGLAAMDYRLTDQYLDPPGLNDPFHTETLIRLDHCNAPFQPHVASQPVKRLPALDGQPFTFASLNSAKKLSAQTILLWAKILHRVPHSRLFISDASDPAIVAWLTQLFAASGIANDRLCFKAWMPIDEFLHLLHDVDLALDPFPYNGATTSMHALYMGVPVVTLAGRRSVSRCGVVVLSRAGLQEFVAATEDEYLEIAVSRANNLDALNALRQNLRPRILSNPVNAPQASTQAVEAVFELVWERWRSAMMPTEPHATGSSPA